MRKFTDLTADEQALVSGQYLAFLRYMARELGNRYISPDQLRELADLAKAPDQIGQDDHPLMPEIVGHRVSGLRDLADKMDAASIRGITGEEILLFTDGDLEAADAILTLIFVARS